MPLVYVAYLSVVPVSRRILGVPVTVTGTLNPTVTAITLPVVYEPLAVVDDTLVTVGSPAAKADTDKLESKITERNTNKNTFDAVKLDRYSGMIILFILVTQ